MNTQAVICHIVNWLIDYKERSQTKGFVVGVSGGIDSAVTSTLAAKTGAPTLCLEMPIRQAYSQDSHSRARKHIYELESNFSSVSSVRADLTSVFDQFVETLPEVYDEEERFLTLTNSQSRLRMVTLYYFAGLYRYLVTGTGNKVEDFGVGFFTKYGDGGVDLSPIADLMKSEVYLVGEELGIIEEIMTAQPTDGLWSDDRTDEDQLGASYSELEWAMNFSKKSESNDVLSSRETQVLEIYRNLHHTNQHKMNQIPICQIPDSIKGS